MFHSISHSHIVDFDVSIIRGGDEELGVRGEGQRADGHGMACRDRDTGQGWHSSH